MFVKIVSAVVLGFSCMALAAEATSQPAMPRDVSGYNLPDDHVAIQGYSPVSYFEKGKAEKGDAKFAVTYRGVTYYLASAEQVKSFNADPAKYEPAYGGWCAYGCAKEKKFPIDPNNFKIVDGRLFLFLKSFAVDALDKWNKGDESDQTHKADAYWKSQAKE